MDDTRIATIRRLLDQGTEGNDYYWMEAATAARELLTALESSQADARAIAAVRMETGQLLLEAQRERDAALAEVTRLTTERNVWLDAAHEWAEKNEHLGVENGRLASQVTALTTALETYREARRAMVQAVQSGQAAPQAVTSQILEAEALAGRVLAGVGVGAGFTAGEGLRANVVERSTRAPASPSTTEAPARALLADTPHDPTNEEPRP